mmetsp:Transcript_39137/g.70190  ORF Transcript_39137/g.70190 Transcript_39137/m.70190 type:complete len:217 (+) Transcript_39137:801-1451(+)
MQAMQRVDNGRVQDGHDEQERDGGDSGDQRVQRRIVLPPLDLAPDDSSFLEKAWNASHCHEARERHTEEEDRETVLDRLVGVPKLEPHRAGEDGQCTKHCNPNPVVHPVPRSVDEATPQQRVQLHTNAHTAGLPQVTPSSHTHDRAFGWAHSHRLGPKSLDLSLGSLLLLLKVCVDKVNGVLRWGGVPRGVVPQLIHVCLQVRSWSLVHSVPVCHY